MTKVINMQWIQETLGNQDQDNKTNEQRQDSKLDWILNGRAFKRDIKFKIIAPNSKENGVFCFGVAQHWLDVNGERKRFVCPEQTNHLRHLGIKCPICEAKRQLLSMGFKEEELTEPGKFGPVPVFDPKLTSNLKVVVISSDLKNDWDQQHISILQQNGSFLTRWMVQKYTDKETPDLLQWENSNLVRFSRQSDNSKFEREISFATFNPSPEVLVKLHEQNENLTLPELWKKPTDDEMLAFHQIAEDLKKKYVDARNMMNNAFSEAMNSPVQPQPAQQFQQQPQPVQQVQQPSVQQPVQTQYQPQPQSGNQNPTVQPASEAPTWNSSMTSYDSDKIPF